MTSMFSLPRLALEPLPRRGEHLVIDEIVDSGQVAFDQLAQRGPRERHLLQYRRKLDDFRGYLEALRLHLAVQLFIDVLEELRQLRMTRRESGDIQVVHKLPDNMKDDIGRLDILQIHPLLSTQHGNEHGRSSLSVFEHALDALQLRRFPNPAMAGEQAADGHFSPGDVARQFLLNIIRSQRLLLLPVHV